MTPVSRAVPCEDRRPRVDDGLGAADQGPGDAALGLVVAARLHELLARVERGRVQRGRAVAVCPDALADAVDVAEANY